MALPPARAWMTWEIARQRLCELPAACARMDDVHRVGAYHRTSSPGGLAVEAQAGALGQSTHIFDAGCGDVEPLENVPAYPNELPALADDRARNPA